MAADLQRDALAADLARRMQARTFGDLRILERILRKLEAFPGDFASFADGIKPIDDLTVALIDLALEIAAEDQQRDQAHETARDAVVGGGG